MRKVGDNKFHFSVGKKAQFFILSAVIIASIIVGLATVKNYVGTGDAPKKFYYYSQQLEDETGAVVDYALYSGGNTDKLSDFLQQSITKTKEGYPTMDIYACYSNPTNKNQIWCQNNGTSIITVKSSCNSNYVATLYPLGAVVCIVPIGGKKCVNQVAPSIDYLSINCQNSQLIFNISNSLYSVNIANNSITNSQFYFVLKMNTTAGDYVDTSQSIN